MGEFENPRGQEATKCTRQRSHDDVEGEAESQFTSSVPSRHIVCDTGHHAGFEDAQKKSHATSSAEIVHECCTDGDDTKCERDCWKIPSGAYPLAGHVGRDLKENIGDVKDGEDGVVVVIFQVEVFFETGEPCIPCCYE